MAELTMEELQAKLATLEKEKAELAAAKEESDQKAAGLEVEKATSDEKVKALSADLDNVAAAKTASDKKAADLEAAKAVSEKKASDLAAAKEASDKKAADLSKENSELKAEKKAAAPVTFNVDKAGNSKGIEWEAGNYEFTCPKFTHQKGSEFIDVDVRAMENSDDTKTKQLFDEIKAELVASGSGIVRFVEPNED